MVKNLRNYIGDLYASGNLANNIIIVTAIITGGLILYLAILLILRRIGKKSGSAELKAQILKFKNPTLLFIMVLSVVIISLLFTPALYDTSGLHPFFSQLLTIAAIFCVTWICIRVIRFSRILVLSKYDLGDKDNLKARKVFTQLRVLERITIFVIVPIAFSIALMTFEGIKKIGISLFGSVASDYE